MKIFKLNTFEKYIFSRTFKFFLITFFCTIFIEFLIIYSNTSNISSEINLDKIQIIQITISYLPIMIFKTINYIFFFSAYAVINKLVYTNELIGLKSIGLKPLQILKPYLYIGIIVIIMIYILSIIFPSQYHKHKQKISSISYDSIIKELEPDVLLSIHNVDIIFDKIENNKDMINLFIFYNTDNSKPSKTIHMERASLKNINNQLVIFGENVQIFYINKDGDLTFVHYIKTMNHPIDINVKESIYNKEDVRYLNNYSLFKYCKINYCSLKKHQAIKSEISYRINNIIMVFLNIFMILLILQKTIQRNREYIYDIYILIIMFYTTIIKINYSLAKVSEKSILYAILYLTLPPILMIIVIHCVYKNFFEKNNLKHFFLNYFKKE